jgi:type IV secretion system protein VirD4
MKPDYRIRLAYRDRSCTQPLYFPGRSHGFLCAPARSGKFISILVQILLSWRGSCLYVDPKGQGCAVAARFRAQKLRQKVYRLDPFNLMERLPGVRYCPPLAQIDPMACLDPLSNSFAAEADNIAEAAITSDAHADSHWTNGARGLTSGVIMGLKTRWPRETLATVYRVISGPDLFLFAQDACQYAASQGGGDFIIERLARYAAPGAAENREMLSIISTAITQLQFIGNKCIADSLGGSSFQFEQMKREGITCFLILPGEFLGGNCMKWFRLIVGTAIDAFMREASRRVPVLGILDEFKSAVGKLGVVETAMGLSAGYGLQLLNVFQNLSQLKELWPQGFETFLANSGFQVYFAPRDKTTSDYVSDMAGVNEVRTISKSISERRDGGASINLGYAQHGRKYILPQEACALGNDEALIFGEGIPGVIRAGRRPYFLSPEFKGCYDPDPYEIGRQEDKKWGGLWRAIFG